MQEQIGTAAGTVWHLLEQRGTLTVSKIKQETKLAEPLALMALGWLAREGQITVVKVKNSLQVSLRR
jgi:hypothetical protein